MTDDYEIQGTQHYYVHCSYGWGGRSDGWYYYRIFNSKENDNTLLDRYIDLEDPTEYSQAEIDSILNEKYFGYNALFRTLIIED